MNTAETQEKLPPAPELPKGPVEERQGYSPFPVVGVGASAGGLEALSLLLSHVPAHSGMAFLIVQHLEPRHESKLSELLGRTTKIPVLEAIHGLPVKANHVYVIPPNTNMAIAHGKLLLAPRGDARGPHLPVDYLFRSLAEEQQSRAIAVVLSGTGSDGTQGSCEIKAVGGIAFAQDEKTAAHAGMPRSAVDSGCIDFVLPPEQIASRLAVIAEHPYLAPAPLPTETEPSADESYQKILASVRSVTGVDFRQYRDTTIKRRIMRRMALHTQSLSEYAARLKNDPAEVNALYQDLLINVTSFFREPEIFEALKKKIFPELIKDKPPGDPFRIWVPGCSSGQEAYSLAMAVTEFYDSKPIRPPIQIFATDLDEPGLEKGRTGLYPEGIEGEISPERLRRFFRREDHMYRIDKSIRDMTVFARHNVSADPPFSHLDMVSCRNVLIYLTTPLQKRVLATLHYALKVPGYMVLGNAESVGEYGDLFELKDRAHRIYAKKPVAVRQQAYFSAPDFKAGMPFVTRRPPLPPPAAQDFHKEADRILLGRYAPPGVLVDENFDILQFRGRTGAYLEFPSGEPTTNLLKMARQGLFVELRNALMEAKKHNRVTHREGIRIRSNGDVREISVEVIPVRPPGDGVCYLVLFQEPSQAQAAAPEKQTEPLPATETEAARELVQARQELAATREYLQSMVEQQDAANEELRSANEEILSSNEELQSTNEELETAKEELQSTNEELTTVNEQLQRRNQELDQVNNDLTNLLSSTNIPVLMVGGDLRIRRFTPPAKKVMNLLPTDIGRPIDDLKIQAVSTDLHQVVAQVIETVQPVEREVRDRDGRWYVMRVYPYRTIDNKIDGAMIVLLDVDSQRRSQEELQKKTAQLGRQDMLLELSQDAIIVRDAENRVVSWNRGAQEMYGWAAEETIGRPLDKVLKTDSAQWAELNAELDKVGNWEGELQQTRRDGTPILVHCREVLVRNEAGERSAVLSIKRAVAEVKKVIDGSRRS